jgi:DNA-binding SARP family transcriptional activator
MATVVASRRAPAGSRAASLVDLQARRTARASPPLVEYRVLGPFEVVRRGTEVLPRRAAKERSVLLCLLLRANQIVPAEQLIDSVWGEHPPRCVASALQNCISRIRRELEPGARATSSQLLLTKPPGYLLRVDRCQLDSARLEAMLEHSRDACGRGLLDEAARLLRAGESLWRGPALADFAYEDFARSEIARLEELRLLVVSDRIDVELALGRDALLVCELKRLVGEHPFHERFCGQLMVALYRCGRQAEALAAYRQARQTLIEELGISPSRSLRMLEEAILRQEPFLDERASAAIARDLHKQPRPQRGGSTPLRRLEGATLRGAGDEDPSSEGVRSGDISDTAFRGLL